MNTKSKTIIAVGADHAGFLLKEDLKKYLQDEGYEVMDCGTSGTDSVDYPEYAFAVANKVSSGEAQFGLMVDGAGIGSAIVANKVKGVRAALCYDISTAQNARKHNDANVLTLGAALIGLGLAKQIVDTFLSHHCTFDRHLRRVKMIDAIESEGKINTSMRSDFDQKDKEKELINISSEELTQIAQKVGELLNVGEVPASSGEKTHRDSDMVCVCGVCVEKKPDIIRKFLDFGVDRIGYHDGTGCECVPDDIARCIDHTLLKPDATEEDIKKLCAEAREYHFASVCLSPSYVKLAAKELEGSSVKVCTVVGFPSGAHLPGIKAMETRQAIRDGAREIDMVINIGALKSKQDELVYRDIRQVCEACEDGGAVSKVIIEAAYLTEDEKVRACELAKNARANYVKTSTGFGPNGATVEDIDLMNRMVGQHGIGIKAAGGIKSYADAKEMIQAGATRIGASAGIKILQEAKQMTISN